MSQSLKMVVASHKPYWMPADDCYVPVQVGSVGKEPIDGFLRDDTGDSISEKNPNYCELTGLYWAWRNLGGDHLGLAHYRRHFAARSTGGKRTRVATGEQLADAAAATGIVLPKQRNYYIETNYSQYIHAHHEEDLETTRDIIARRDPKMLWKYDEIMNRTHGHRFNMFVMRRDLADAWCEWLFGILFELEGRLDITDYSPNDARVFGFVSERLLDYWVESNGLMYAEMPVVNLESQHWVKKGASFLARKIRG
ncbi:DUF4422 domain-containing protein [Adlercreutzia sp. ZJ242]|uniref:DUF4422 domain-containing protein n=1 Tax=Adlercreutzia sp. ZJ242 TaxID=2709409 RepID=UPI0013EE3223|nr:DUF4422 domain-containing protein [Adlercreutzia sp. ZJ242]